MQYILEVITLDLDTGETRQCKSKARRRNGLRITARELARHPDGRYGNFHFWIADPAGRVKAEGNTYYRRKS